MPGTPRRRASTSRALALVAWLAFLGTSPGVGGVEALWHVTHGDRAGHALATHLEEAGAASHGDHCHLGPSTAPTTQLPAVPLSLLESFAEPGALPAPARPAPSRLVSCTLHARAPPQHG